MIANTAGIGTSESLTLAAYLVLMGLIVWLGAHFIAIIRAFIHSPLRDWMEVTGVMTRRLREITDQAGRVNVETDRALVNQLTPMECLDLRNKIHAVIARGPGRNIEDWTGGGKPSAMPANLRSMLQMVRCYPDEPVQEVLDYVLEKDRSRWTSRLGLLSAAGPPAGAAPTMSATMTFLKSYSESSAAGLPSFGAIHDALLTTYLGCAICVFGIILLTLVHGQFRKYHESMSVSATSLFDAHRDWRVAARRIHNQLETIERSLHEKPQKA